jgi:hypothetical protein
MTCDPLLRETDFQVGNAELLARALDDQPLASAFRECRERLTRAVERKWGTPPRHCLEAIIAVARKDLARLEEQLAKERMEL